MKNGLLFYINMLGKTVQRKTLEESIEMPVAEPYHPEVAVPGWLDTWRPWVVLTVLPILASYGPVLIDLLSNMQLTSPGFNVW